MQRNKEMVLRNNSLMLMALAGVVVHACSFSADTLTVQMESFSPREIPVGTVKESVIAFQLNKPANVRLVIRDWDGDVVAERTQTFGAGRQEFKWDTECNRPRTDGVYTFALEATTNDGLSAKYDPGFESGLEQLQITSAHFDSKSGELEYAMPQMGMVRARVCRDDFLLIRTLQNWTPRLAGKYSIKWDAKDQSGNVINTDDPRIICRLMAYSLPENAFLINGTGKSKPARSLKDQIAWRGNPVLQKKFYHAGIPREQSLDAGVSLTFLDMEAKKALDDEPKIASTVKARVRLNAPDEPTLTNERFEICVYVDGTLWFEDEDGVSPFTFDLDPRGMNAGEHVLTVWILSTADHMGVVSRHFNVTSEEKSKRKAKDGE
jgi:hypothetical protein